MKIKEAKRRIFEELSSTYQVYEDALIDPKDKKKCKDCNEEKCKCCKKCGKGSCECDSKLDEGCNCEILTTALPRIADMFFGGKEEDLADIGDQIPTLVWDMSALEDEEKPEIDKEKPRKKEKSKKDEEKVKDSSKKSKKKSGFPYDKNARESISSDKEEYADPEDVKKEIMSVLKQLLPKLKK